MHLVIYLSRNLGRQRPLSFPHRGSIHQYQGRHQMEVNELSASQQKSRNVQEPCLLPRVTPKSSSHQTSDLVWH